MSTPKINLEPLAINEILEKKFFIRHYQRGYRWTQQQVEQLLDDIDAFVPREVVGDANKKTFYCLQPVVVKRLEADSIPGRVLEGEWLEVVDGQQRLTTIYLILRYMNDLWLGRQKIKLFEIDYETRDQCVEFLQQIEVNDDEVTVQLNKKNIDFYHISMAYQTIRDWELNYTKKYDGKILDNANFQSKFLSFSKVIWYEVGRQEDSVELFERLNLGKIPLTNAELTKALFLAADSFKNLGKEEQRIKQFEIALLWDEIEHKLNELDQKFWSFITNKKREAYDTKIDIILDLIAEKSDSEQDPLFTFIQFSQKNSRSGGQNLLEIWTEIEQFYYTLVEWNNDRNLYHRIGYLITSREVPGFKKLTIHELVKFSMTHDKETFHARLKSQIKNSVAFELSELRYGDDPDKLFNVLLLFNVETYRCSKAISEFYPFKQHKGNLWSLEHIHARNSDGLDKNKREQWREWLEHHAPLLPELHQNGSFSAKADEVKIAISDIDKYNTETLTWQRFLEIFKRVNNLLTHDADEINSESDGLSNMALLSQPDNASLNSSAFEVKRRKIIEMDKDGHFIPVCTRRVFLKYYNAQNSPAQSFFWSPGDRRNYFKELKDALREYLPHNVEEVNDED